MTGDNCAAVILTTDSEVLRAVINRPRTRNAVSLAVLAGLESMIATARQQQAKVVVLLAVPAAPSAPALICTASSAADQRPAGYPVIHGPVRHRAPGP